MQDNMKRLGERSTLTVDVSGRKGQGSESQGSQIESGDRPKSRAKYVLMHSA